MGVTLNGIAQGYNHYRVTDILVENCCDRPFGSDMGVAAKFALFGRHADVRPWRFGPRRSAQPTWFASAWTCATGR